MQKKILLATITIIMFHAVAYCQTVDDKLRRKPQDAQFIAAETCDPNCTITITNAKNGAVVIGPGETKYFEITQGAASWMCCDNRGHTNLKAGIIQAKRTGNRTEYSFVAQPKY